ncbi:MAG: DEAD/DEAH box helicase, partial [Acidimicrobiales bacterium]
SWWRRPAARLGLRLDAGPASTAAPASARRTGRLTLHGLAAVDWTVVFGEEEVDLAELRRLARLKVPLVQVRGQWMELRAEELEKLLAFLGSGHGRRELSVLDVVRAASGAAPLDAGVPVVGVEATGALAQLLHPDAATLSVPVTPEGFCGELRAYQRRGVGWIELLESAGLGACLADDMGLGKTATVLGVLQAERAADTGRAAPPLGPTLVVCPTSIVGNWVAEVRRFTPGLTVVVHHGATRARGESFGRAVEDADVVVTSYPLVERDRAAIASVPWRRLVLDEAQQVKNPLAKQTQAVRALRAPRRLALTGTPVENHLGDLWSMMEILNPGLLGSQTSFREGFAVPIERYGDEGAADRLRTLTRPFVLRRLKTDKSIISDLPDKLEMKVRCSLTREQASLYQAVVDEMLEHIASAAGIERKGLVLATMLRLKQVCNHPAQYLGDASVLPGRSGKLERTGELLEEVREAGEKALVFTQFAEMGAMLQQHLQQRLGCRVGFLHGGVPRVRRDALVSELQAPGDELAVLVLSLQAGGTGLNLTAANHVVHYDRWWNPAVEDQATDRAFRIGQRRDVQVRKLVCAGTVEDRIDEMIESKRALADRVVGTGEAWLTELSTDELADVLRLSTEAVG